MQKELTNDQKIIEHLAKTGQLTQIGEIAKALNDPKYATKLINFDVLENDEIVAIDDAKIQEVFDNDNDE